MTIFCENVTWAVLMRSPWRPLTSYRRSVTTHNTHFRRRWTAATATTCPTSGPKGMKRQRGVSVKISRKNQSPKKNFLISGEHFSRRFQARRVQKTKKKFSLKKFSLCGLRLFSPSRHFSVNCQLPAPAIRSAWKLRVVCHDIIDKRSPYYRLK
jgi:hypothetical protein